MNRARRRPDLVLAEIRELDDKIDDMRTVRERERENWFVARRRDTFRLADVLRPKHTSAVRAMVAALEKLSAAAKNERDIRKELERDAPEPNSGLLPDFGFPWVAMRN
jgi:hypothetical protein